MIGVVNITYNLMNIQFDEHIFHALCRTVHLVSVFFLTIVQGNALILLFLPLNVCFSNYLKLKLHLASIRYVLK